jgi:RNA ligase
VSTLDDVLDAVLLERMLEERFVVRREHPTLPLAILNYTERCQYENGAWNAVTRQCRGLIYRTDTREVVARPFRKFFNYGQSGGAQLDLDSPASVTDKLDGSLGILYPIPDGHAIATRGSFAGEQALHATALWAERYSDYAPPAGLTLLFEIVYPSNRIVVDYGATDDLFLLAGVSIATGRSIPGEDVANWPGPRAARFDYPTLTAALTAPVRRNAEGLVVHVLSTDERVKLKQEDYVALHRLVTGLNERTVWEHLKNGKPIAELIAPLPDEFHEWTRAVAARLLATVEDGAAEIERTYAATVADLPTGHTRKDFALRAVASPFKWALFARRDGKDYRPGLWEHARPGAFLTPRGQTFTEDTA